jgi:hypothetical protein
LEVVVTGSQEGSVYILFKRCAREKSETVSLFSKRLLMSVLRRGKSEFCDLIKPYGKFFEHGKMK